MHYPDHGPYAVVVRQRLMFYVIRAFPLSGTFTFITFDLDLLLDDFDLDLDCMTVTSEHVDIFQV